MSNAKAIKGGVCSAKGFRAAGVAAEVKYKGRNDVALIVADAPCAAAAVFSDELFSAYGRGDRGAFRSVLRSGTGALLCWSGCAFLASGLCWLFAG